MVLSVLSVTQKPAPFAFVEFAAALEVADAGPRSLTSGDVLVLRNGSRSVVVRPTAKRATAPASRAAGWDPYAFGPASPEGPTEETLACFVEGDRRTVERRAPDAIDPNRQCLCGRDQRDQEMSRAASGGYQSRAKSYRPCPRDCARETRLPSLTAPPMALACLTKPHV